MKSVVLIFILMKLAASVPEQKLRESDDGSKFYIETAQKYNWFEAWSDCARKNMSLIAIDTYAKHQQIDNLLKRLHTSCPSLWIAGHDNAVHTRYEWATTGQTFTFTNWGPGQPADGAKDEHCFLIWSDFQWHDYKCSGKLGYICEENPLIKRMHQNQMSESVKVLGEFKNFVFHFKNGN